MTADKIGRIVWHDLFSSDRQRSMAFYRRVAGWTYVTEHATDFAWGGGEKDFVLALLDGEAGAGFAETPNALPDGWTAYVEVADVDASITTAERLGGTIIRRPFEVPGVGRNALIRDPLGALIGLSLSRHDFPAPTRQFGAEVYMSDTPAFPIEFYAGLFDWSVTTPPIGAERRTVILGPSGERVATHLAGSLPDETALWIPSLRVENNEAALRHAEQLGARPFSSAPLKHADQRYALLRDPDGACVCLPENERRRTA